MKIILATLQFAVGLLFVGIAFAADFTFDVPIELHNVHPDVIGAFITCQVLDERGLVMSPPAPFTPTSGFRNFAVPGGNYSGVVTAELSVLEPARARRYNCELALQITRDSVAVAMLEAAYIARYGRDASVPSVWRVQGDIPAPSR